jgi:hypothetical protein
MNYPQQSAQGLASLGRGNDSMLMHVTPREVEGLQGLAMAHGGSLTINPQTGLPEAGFLDSILPMAAGFALGPGGFGLFSSPLMAGLTVGGITALASGDIGKGIMAGLGAGGGAGLGSTFAKMGQNAVGGIAPQAAKDAVVSTAVQGLPANVAQNAATNLGMFNAPGATAAMGGVGATVPNAVQSLATSPSNLGMFNTGATGATSALAPSSTQIAESTLSQPLSGFGASGKGFGEFIKDPFDKGFEAFKQAGGKDGVPLTSGEAAYELGSPVATLALSGMEPPVPQPYIDPDTGKYRGPQGQLNLSDRFDTGLRLAAGGAVGNPSVGQGISDLYNRPEGQASEIISQDGYGIGRLNSLANAEAMNNAKTLGYADGGDVGMNLNDSPLNLNLVGAPTDSASGNNQNPLLGLFGGQFGAKGMPTRDPIQMGMYGMNNPLFSLFQRFSPPKPKSYNLNVNTGKQEPQYADGGYLNGDGDGMSDSIPATIEGKQPARLADGEFVVPADVVSHLGNGSSKAGSKRLYAMLDKVRHARTGNKKQGKEIKADKYLPA